MVFFILYKTKYPRRPDSYRENLGLAFVLYYVVSAGIEPASFV